MIKLILRVFTAICVIWFIGLMVFAAWVTTETKPCTAHAEGIVVFTGGGKRVDTGLALLAEGNAERLLISGVGRDVKESELLSLSHRDRALETKIDLGFSALDTMGNADEAAQWVQRNGFKSLIVVTSNYHMPRALIHLGTQLPDVALYACAVTPDVLAKSDWYKYWSPWRLLLNDYNKFLMTYPQILLLKYTH